MNLVTKHEEKWLWIISMTFVAIMVIWPFVSPYFYGDGRPDPEVLDGAIKTWIK